MASKYRHIVKATPFAPLSYIMDLLRFMGLNTENKGIDDTVEGFDSILDSTAGKYFGTTLTGQDKAIMQFNADEAQKNRDFQERMSSTTYQRTVQDMKLAGLNPALLLTGASGVSTPSGSSASASPSSGGSISDLMSLALLPFQMANISANTKKTEAETESEIPAKVQQLLASASQASANAQNLNLDSEAKEVVLKYLDQQQQFYTVGLGLSNSKVQQEINESVARCENLDAQHKKILQDIVESQQRVQVLLAQEQLTEAQVHEVYETIKNIRQSTELLQNQTKLTEKDIKWYTANSISNMVGDVGNAIGSVAGGLGRAAAGFFSRKRKQSIPDYHDPFGYLAGE